MGKKVGRFRYLIGSMFFCMVLVNYFDRVNLSAATPSMMKELHMTPAMFGVVASAFGWTYLLLQIPTGMLLDKFGVKWLARIGTLLWAVPTFLTALVSGLAPLIILRMFLGVAEAPALSAASKATGYWFPFKERGFATSLFESASKFSNVIGVPLCAFIVMEFGWRKAFLVTAFISLAFAIWFWILYRDPKDHPSLSNEELEYIQKNGAQEQGKENTGKGLKYLLKQRKVWGLGLSSFAYNYSIYMFLTWLPGYLVQSTGMNILKSGLYTAIPWLIGTLTDLLIGGLLVDHLIKKGKNSSIVRKSMIVIGLILGTAVLGATTTRNATIAIFWISIAVAGLSITAPIFWSIPSIIAPKGLVGTVGGILNLFGNIAATITPIITGIIVGATGSFSSAFILAAIVLFGGIFAVTILLGKIEQIPSPHEDSNTTIKESVSNRL